MLGIIYTIAFSIFIILLLFKSEKKYTSQDIKIRSGLNEYWEDGSLKEIKNVFPNGSYSISRYERNGDWLYKKYFDKEGRLHSAGQLPAAIYANGNETYAIFGVINRIKYPYGKKGNYYVHNFDPITGKYENKEYYNENDQLHREGDLPAIIAKNYKSYALNGEWYKIEKFDEEGFLHDKNYPALIYKNENKEKKLWYNHGEWIKTEFYNDDVLERVINPNTQEYFRVENGVYFLKAFSDGSYVEKINLLGKHISTIFSDEKGLPHRESLPAVITCKVKHWYDHGVLTREEHNEDS